MTDLTEVATAAVRGHVARLGLRQVAIAEALGVSQTTVSYKLRGLTPLTIADLEAFAALFGVPVRDLLEPSADPSGESK